ncbi:MAG: hypothetical protein R3D80_18190 [Paracoccaceae bacterium]
MKLSAPTQPVFIISLILAVIGTLPLVGVSIPIGISAVGAGAGLCRVVAGRALEELLTRAPCRTACRTDGPPGV